MSTTRDREKRLTALERRRPEPLTIIVLYEDADGTTEEAYRVTVAPEVLRQNGGERAELS